MKYGVPFDIVFDLSPNERTAFIVMFGEMDGGSFDWRTGQWADRK